MTTPVLKLKAARIVVLMDRGVLTFVCFKFQQAGRKAAADFLAEGTEVEITVEDSNGEFVNGRKHLLLEVEVPNESFPIGGSADVLIIKAIWK